MNDLVSIIIPTYNNAKLLPSALNSVLSQSYKNYEVLIIDDGSTDDTKNIVFTFNDSRINYIYIKHSGLPAVARNVGIINSQGNLIAFLDSDDVWMDNKLEKTIKCFDYGDDIGLVTTKGYIVDENLKNSYKTAYDFIQESNTYNFRDTFLFCPISLSSVVLKKKYLFEVGLFDERICFKAVEDYHLWLKIATRCKVFFLNETLFYYRVHSNSLSKNFEEQLMNTYYSMLDIKKQYPELIRPFHAEANSSIREIQFRIMKYNIKRFCFIKTIKRILRFIYDMINNEDSLIIN